MPKPPRKEINPEERLKKILAAGLLKKETKLDETIREEVPEIGDLKTRFINILGIIRSKPQKSTNMNYFVLYDIEDNKVRNQVSKYLQRKGCIRVQKSVFLANSESKTFNEIYKTLHEINSFYENADSILLLPVNVSDVRSMKIIGKNLQVDTIIDTPNSLFF